MVVWPKLLVKLYKKLNKTENMSRNNKNSRNCKKDAPKKPSSGMTLQISKEQLTHFQRNQSEMH
jgi:hypothetical protein